MQLSFHNLMGFHPSSVFKRAVFYAIMIMSISQFLDVNDGFTIQICEGEDWAIDMFGDRRWYP